MIASAAVTPSAAAKCFARRQASDLNAVDSFVGSQRRVLTPALDKLSPANAERARKSVNLLDAVERRADNLREGLGCSTVTQSRSDALGPELSACKTGASTSSSPEHQQGQGQSEKKSPSGKGENAKKTAKPKVSSEAPATSQATGDKTKAPAADEAGPSAAVTQDPAPMVSDDPAHPSTAEDKGLLGGLLGGIFGSD